MTTIKETARELDSGDQRFQKLFNLSMDAIFIHDMDGGIHDVNDQACLSLGYSREDLLQLTMWEVGTGYSQEKITGLLENIAKGQRDKFADSHRRKNGSIFPVELSLELLRELEPQLFLAVARDITEHKITKEALLASQVHYKYIFDNSPIPMWEEDFSELYVYINELKERGVHDFGPFLDNNPDILQICSRKVHVQNVNKAALDLHEAKTKEELLGNLDKIFTEQSYEVFKDEVTAIAEGRTSFEAEGEVKTLAGESRSILLTLALHKEKSGRIGGMVATVDTTSKKNEEKLRTAQLELIEYGVHHSVKELLQCSLDKAEELTGSAIGFFHFVEDNQQALELQTWSTNTLEKMCTAEGHNHHYSIKKAGVWVDCVRQAQPVVHNDYASLSHKKGLPEGHALIVRELVVPVFRDGKIVAILGVGNKGTDYNKEDINTVQLLADMAWEIIFRKKSEKALRQSEEKLRSIFRAVPVGIGFVIDRTIYEINQQFLDFIGYSREEMIGSSARMLYQSDEEYERVGKVQYQDIDERGLSTIETCFKRKDGLVIDVQLRTTPLDHDDLSGGFTIVVHDISRSKKAEAEIKLQAAALHAAANAIIISDVDGNIVWANPSFSKLTGFTLDESITQKINIVKSGKHDESFYKDMWKKISSGDVWQGEVVNKRKDGTTYMEELSITPLKTPEGEIINYIAIKQDITERKEAEEKIREYSTQLESMVEKRTAELKKAQHELVRQEKLAAIGKLSGSVAHDIRNPLGAISNSVYFLGAISNKDTNDIVKKHIAIMEHELIRANTIIEDLLDFSRDNQPVFSEGDVNSLLQQAVSECAFSKEIEIVWELDVNLKLIQFDSSQLQRVFNNILENSRHAMGNSGALQVQTTHDDTFVRISITDSGHGIEEEQRIHLFEPLYTTKAKGVGLGLTIVENFVAKHGGSVEVQSKVGKETTFTVLLPIVLRTP